MRWYPLLCVAILAGCAMKPVSREEYVSSVGRGGALARIIEGTVARPYEQVVADLQRKFDQCMNIRRQSAMTIQGVRSTSYYHSTTRAAGPNKTEFTYRADSGKPAAKPDDGDIMAATDVDRLPGNKTKVVTYTGWGHEKIGNAIKSWAEGKAANCPDPGS